ncbi:MAG: hypothetical protein WCY06_08550 [Flavobacteriaceae bacterium]
MKKLLLYIILFLSLDLFAQDTLVQYIINNQERYFKLGEEELKKSNEFRALEYFHSICFLQTGLKISDAKRTDTEIEIIAKKRVDSLLPFFQQRELKKWQGRWQLKNLNDREKSSFNYKHIEITPNEILFFNEKDPESPVRVEQIKFRPYDGRDLSLSEYFNWLEFENTEWWEFKTEKIKREIRLYPSIKRRQDGVKTHIIKDIFMGSKRKYKKTEREYKDKKTYYILEKISK